MMKFLLSKHSRSIFIFALLSLFMCMAAGKVYAEERNPVVKIDNTSYTSSGTEVTLRLWMFNWKYAVPNTKKYNARFTGDVSLYIDDKEVGKLNSMWGLISGSSYTFFKDEPGIVGKSSDINLDGTNVGTAQFQDLKSVQTCPYNNNTTENSWYTVDLKLSFNKSFSYYGHKITVKGKWQDQSSGSVVEKNVTLANDINGFVRPINLKVQPSGDNMVFSWKQQGYNNNASTLGKWIVYKREDGNNVKLGEVAANEHSLSIEKKQYSCSNGYIMTFLPNVCEGEETVCGLTTSLAATGHQINDDDICQMCGHSFFRYHTSDGNIVDISGKDFGANVVSHEVVDGECVIEFDAPITKIPQYAFKTTKLVGELRIPNTVTSIQDYAFNLCTGLTGNLVIPNSVTEIGNNAFYKCTGFNGTLTLSSNLKTIGDNAFYECSGFTGSLTLPNSVTTIGRSAFIFCNSFTNLELPKALSAIPYQAFRNCSGLSGNLVIPDGVTEIGEYAFYGCPGFKGTLKLSSNLKTIGKYAFYSCSGFTKIEFPETMSLNVIPEWTFWGCTSLSGNLVIPNSVTKIGDNAFYNCKGFNGTLTLSNNLKVIGENAFEQCSGFTGALTLPNSLTTIESMTFMGCSGFTGNLTIPNSVTTIGSYAFNNCSGFTGDLIIPNSVTKIGNEAFSDCSGFTGNLTISNSVTTIGNYTFFRCSGFTGDLIIPNSVTTIGIEAFSYCSEFKGNLTIPNSVTTIEERAFLGCSGFTGNLTIPNSVTTIGPSAFLGCSGFTGNLTISNSVTTIGKQAFYECYGFTGDLTIPNSVTTIENSTFENCFGFKGKLTIPNSVTTIGNSAFGGCFGFTGKLTIPNSVTTIGNSAFGGCSGFTGKLTIPNSVTTIGYSAFGGCSGFTGDLIIPNSVTTIGNLAFRGCSGFTGDLSLPKSLEIVGSLSFTNCKKIKTIKFQSLPKVLDGSLDNYINYKAIFSLSDDSYISDKASGTVNAISYTRVMTSNWGTLVLPYPLKLTGNEPYRLYSIDNMTGEELVLKQLEGVVAAGTPCVVKRNGSEAELTFGNNKAKLNMAINDQLMDGMNFSGTYWTKDVTNGYIIAKDCFWSVAELNKSDLVKGVKVKPFRAWLDGTSPNGASQLSICVSDTATGIGAAGTIDVLNDTATEYYDLSGKRLDEPQKGVNIVRMKSGKTMKIIIK